MQNCEHCKRVVKPTKYPSWITLIALVALGFFSIIFSILLFLIYITYYLLFKKSECPICRGSDFTLTEAAEEELKMIDNMSMKNLMTNSYKTDIGKNKDERTN